MNSEAFASGRDTGSRLGWTVAPIGLPLRRITYDPVVPLHRPCEEGPHYGDLGLNGRWLGTLTLTLLSIALNVCGPEHPNVAPILENYAALLREMDREDEAEEMEARAKAIRAKQPL